MTDAPITLPITLTDAAAGRLAALSEAEGRPVLLRIAVEGGGCSGFQYRFDLVKTADADDLRIENAGQAALVDEMSLVLLKGAQIDFIDELAGAEFKIRNPNARTSCGCGVSFSI
jgi:iron-sulfur cluster insertion protein